MTSLRLDQPIRDLPFDVVVIGASRGGVSALSRLLASFPSDFPIPIAIVQHRSAKVPSPLPNIVGRNCSLSIKEGSQGEIMRNGAIYLAPPNHHLLFDRTGRLELSDMARVNYVRPSVDVLFEAAAAIFKNRVLGVVLTGGGHDGANGVVAIKAVGGVTIAQNQASSEAFDMPRAAIQTRQIDFVLPLDSIAAAIITLTMVTGARTVFRVPAFPALYSVYT